MLISQTRPSHISAIQKDLILHSNACFVADILADNRKVIHAVPNSGAVADSLRIPPASNESAREPLAVRSTPRPRVRARVSSHDPWKPDTVRLVELRRLLANANLPRGYRCLPTPIVLCTFRPITAGIFLSQVSVTERSLRGRPAAHHHDEFLSKRAS